VLDLGKGDPCGFLKDEPFKPARSYINRIENRRVLWGQIAPNGVSSAAAVGGVTKTGKTALLKWCLGLRALHGDNVAYVDLAHANRLRTREVLEAIARALENAPDAFKAQNKAAMDAFRAEIAGLPEKLEDWDALIKPFTRGLAAAAGEGNLLIALDHLRGAEPWSFKAHVGDLLVLPLAVGEPIPVRILLALDGTEQSTLLSPDLDRELEIVPLELLEGTEFAPVAIQFLRALGYRQDQIEPVVGLAQGLVGATWDATRFEWLVDTATGFKLAREDDA
jgi:hypothetical protein